MGPDFLLNLLTVAIIVSILDFIWIGGYLLNHFRPMIERVQKEPMVVNPYYVIISYIILITLVTIIIPKCSSIEEAFLIGFLVYAVYDSTNFATLKNWDFSIALVDSLWGGVLFALTYYIMISP